MLRSIYAQFMWKWLLPLMAIFLCSCASGPPPPTTTIEVDLNRYSGKWYQLAAYPQWFQRGCASSIAEYGVPEADRLSVRNTCVANDGTTRSIEGNVMPIADSNNAKLLVTFDKWFQTFIPEPDQGNYWIVYLDPDYRYAIVSSESRSALWLLARNPTISKGDWQHLIGIIEKAGFEAGKLKIDAHTKIG